ncbi:unnamed protein product [Rotaria sp. Silwood2]|nr:unnamed protein product [Rotaria sp. Silwood2]CAF4431569.1 unnamed protein product [Rotaria sp. Silwood2]
MTAEPFIRYPNFKYKNGVDGNDTQSSTVTPTAIVESLYKSVPETNKFTRSLSNPEMVKKIQQDRLKQKFIKISTKEGGKNSLFN